MSNWHAYLRVIENQIDHVHDRLQDDCLMSFKPRADAERDRLAFWKRCMELMTEEAIKHDGGEQLALNMEEKR